MLRTIVQQRYMFVNEVVGPVKWEAAQIADAAKQWPHRIEYSKQAFDVRLKEFWPLHRLAHVRKAVIPALLHENDGLILQARPRSASSHMSLLLVCCSLVPQVCKANTALRRVAAAPADGTATISIIDFYHDSKQPLRPE
jgi:mRNA capping enzyme, catalytic domain